jgi:hypothetical protein
MPLPDGAYFSACDTSENIEYLKLHSRNLSLGWRDGGAISEFQCEITTRTKLTQSKALPRAEVLELSCRSPAGEASEDALFKVGGCGVPGCLDRQTIDNPFVDNRRLGAWRSNKAPEAHGGQERHA